MNIAVVPSDTVVWDHVQHSSVCVGSTQPSDTADYRLNVP